jgi:hypothetical protein
LRQAVRNQIAEAQKIASGSGSEADIAEAKIELEVRSERCMTFMGCKMLTTIGPREPAGSIEVIVYIALCSRGTHGMYSIRCGAYVPPVWKE